MRIMFFTLSLQGGGAERVIASLSNEMVKNNEVIIATVHNNRDCYELDKSIKRVCIDRNKRGDRSKIKNKLQKISPRRIKELARIIDDESPDVVVAFLPLPSLYIMLVKRFIKKAKNVPVILSERADPNREYNNKLIFAIMKKLFRNADGFVFQTEEAKHFYDEIINCKTEVIANPIGKSFLNHRQLKNRRKTIVSCGRLEKQKNYDLLVRVFADVANTRSDYTLEIYGEGSRMGELKALSKELGVDDKVFLKGRVKDVASKIADAGVFVMSSDYEGMPNALMEAMALGIPCISTDCPVGGPKSLINDNNNGLLVGVGDRKMLTEAVLRIISNRDFALELSKNGMKTCESYTVEKIAEKWLAFINGVVGAH